MQQAEKGTVVSPKRFCIHGFMCVLRVHGNHPLAFSSQALPAVGMCTFLPGGHGLEHEQTGHTDRWGECALNQGLVLTRFRALRRKHRKKKLDVGQCPTQK